MNTLCFTRRVFSCLLLSLLCVSILVGSECFAQSVKRTIINKLVIGPTALVEEAESAISFAARVDTGATSTSLHVEEFKVENESKRMVENVGKTIRFRIKNIRGEAQWLKRKIAEISVIKTSERQEVRYKVPVTLNCNDVEKRVLVSLNDRSHMKYPVLLGRNYLQDTFVVDVALAEDHLVKNKSSHEPTPKKKSDIEAAGDSSAKKQ